MLFNVLFTNMNLRESKENLMPAAQNGAWDKKHVDLIFVV